MYLSPPHLAILMPLWKHILTCNLRPVRQIPSITYAYDRPLNYLNGSSVPRIVTEIGACPGPRLGSTRIIFTRMPFREVHTPASPNCRSRMRSLVYVYSVYSRPPGKGSDVLVARLWFRGLIGPVELDHLPGRSAGDKIWLHCSCS